MLIYVSHKYGGDLANVEKAKKITHDLQIKDLENCYICPLNTFSHLTYNEIGYEQEMSLCFDLMTACDAVLVASEESEGVRREIELAKKRNMEIMYLNKKEASVSSVSLIDGHIDKVERCVMCGKVIPEGWQVCYGCERKTKEKELKEIKLLCTNCCKVFTAYSRETLLCEKCRQKRLVTANE